MDVAGSLNCSESDFSEASVVSFGRSLQSDLGDSTERTPLVDAARVPLQGHDRQPVGTSWYVSIFLVANAALGAGLLNFPYAYNECGGIAVAIAVQAALAVFVIGSTVILTYCAQVHNSTTYQDVVFACCGRIVRSFCSVAIALYSFGTCVTFLIIIGDQWDKFLSLAYGPTFCKKWYMTRQFTIGVTSVLLILPLCFPRRIDFLKYASVVGSVAVLYCVLLVSVKYFVGASHHKNCPVKRSPDSWMDIFTVVPVICFGYQCHLSLVPIYACTKERTLMSFLKTILIALLLCFLSYTVTASFGYLTFGSCVQPDILSSYSPTPDVLIAVIFVAIKMYTTYPILLFVGRAAVDSVYADIRQLAIAELERFERLRRIVMSLLWFIASLLIALFVQDISVVISLLGDLAALFIFVFPGLCLLQLLLQGSLGEVMCWSKYSTYVVMSGSCLVLGGFLFGLTVTQSLMNDVSNFSSHVHRSTYNCS